VRDYLIKGTAQSQGTSPPARGKVFPWKKSSCACRCCWENCSGWSFDVLCFTCKGAALY